MKKIQVDMFEVQLGAALLMQFRLRSGQVVRVLADAGVDNHSGYQREHVYNKLFQHGSPTAVWTDFSSDVHPKLDLIVGTHYDADHLLGLVPIIEDTQLEIDEIWLPPVQDDEGNVSTSGVSSGEASLAKRLMADDGGEVLMRYLSRRQKRIDDVEAIYDAGLMDTHPNNHDENSIRSSLKRRTRERRERIDHLDMENTERALEYFERQKLVAIDALRAEESGHAHELRDTDDQAFADAVDELKHQKYWWSPWDIGLIGRTEHDRISRFRLEERWHDDTLMKADLMALETIRKSAANEAITAANLAKVVEAIKHRHSNGGSRIRIVSEAIPVGKPRYFRWSGNRFQEANPAVPSELGFHLMGPSHELIAQLHEKLPIGTYLLAYRTADLKSGTVTPSNRLSYVMRFHLNDQSILVTGDAGFTDFAPARSSDYHPALLALLKPLHVVQVAHHGGMNHRFYEALNKAGLPGQTDWSFLLLSHATHDSTRPRAEFSRFAAQFRLDSRNDVSVLFTSQPERDKVDTILDLIHPAVPSSAPQGDRGDVRLSYPHENDPERGGTPWRVEKHGIRI